MAGTTSFAKPLAVSFDAAMMTVELDDGRRLGIPLAWFPRLLKGAPDARLDFFLTPRGIHWDTLDEDISIAGLLEGRGDMTAQREQAA